MKSTYGIYDKKTGQCVISGDNDKIFHYKLPFLWTPLWWEKIIYQVTSLIVVRRFGKKKVFRYGFFEELETHLN